MSNENPTYEQLIQQAQGATPVKAEASKVEIPPQATASVAFKKITIEFGPDGMPTFTIDGKAVTNLASGSMSFYNEPEYGSYFSFGYSLRDPDPQPGQLEQRTYFSYIRPERGDASVSTKPVAELMPRQRHLFAKV